MKSIELIKKLWVNYLFVQLMSKGLIIIIAKPRRNAFLLP